MRIWQQLPEPLGGMWKDGDWCPDSPGSWALGEGAGRSLFPPGHTCPAWRGVSLLPNSGRAVGNV